MSNTTSNTSNTSSNTTTGVVTRKVTPDKLTSARSELGSAAQYREAVNILAKNPGDAAALKITQEHLGNLVQATKTTLESYRARLAEMRREKQFVSYAQENTLASLAVQASMAVFLYNSLARFQKASERKEDALEFLKELADHEVFYRGGYMGRYSTYDLLSFMRGKPNGNDRFGNPIFLKGVASFPLSHHAIIEPSADGFSFKILVGQEIKEIVVSGAMLHKMISYKLASYSQRVPFSRAGIFPQNGLQLANPRSVDGGYNNSQFDGITVIVNMRHEVIQDLAGKEYKLAKFRMSMSWMTYRAVFLAPGFALYGEAFADTRVLSEILAEFTGEEGYIPQNELQLNWVSEFLSVYTTSIGGGKYARKAEADIEKMFRAGGRLARRGITSEVLKDPVAYTQAIDEYNRQQAERRQQAQARRAPAPAPTPAQNTIEDDIPDVTETVGLQEIGQSLPEIDLGELDENPF